MHYLASAQISFDALLAECIWAIVAAHKLSPIGTPAAVLVETLGILDPFATMIKIVALGTLERFQHRMLVPLAKGINLFVAHGT